jgi:hypothetical protein
LLKKYFANEINGVFVYNWLFNEHPDWMQNIGVFSPYDWNINEKPAEIAITQQFSKPSQIGAVDIHVLPFSQTISGTPEIDRVVFSENFETASLSNGSSSTSVQLRGETYTLQKIERLQFKDQSIALDTDGVAGQGYRIYKAAFDRIPDSGGLGYWIAQMDKGMNVTEVAARFIDPPEFRSLYGQNPSNAEFLAKVYTNVLGRTPDQGGYDWWLNELNTNPDKTRQKVLADFSESQENKDSVAALIGNGIQYVEFTG